MKEAKCSKEREGKKGRTCAQACDMLANGLTSHQYSTFVNWHHRQHTWRYLGSQQTVHGLGPTHVHPHLFTHAFTLLCTYLHTPVRMPPPCTIRTAVLFWLLIAEERDVTFLTSASLNVEFIIELHRSISSVTGGERRGGSVMPVV